jgi:hypothetical protein
MDNGQWTMAEPLGKLFHVEHFIDYFVTILLQFIAAAWRGGLGAAGEPFLEGFGLTTGS